MRDMVLPAVTSFEWSADASALYYTTADDTGRPSRVRKACDGTAASPAQQLCRCGPATPVTCLDVFAAL